ncbi:MAG: hypothetical protein LBR27_03575 [Bifidobacteriaceae bacterium]|jgi:hypothetical protein|nr:hypothetical protein [Bifidobacteriaceae bacterium]
MKKQVKGIIAAVVTVAVLGGAAGAAIWWGKRSDDQGTKAEAKVRTAVVERTSLAASLQINGTLVYGDPHSLAGGGGVVTKLPEAGAILDVGDVLMETEGNPVILIHGAIPLWRDLTPGVSGIDVTMLRGALTELGYDVGDPESQTYDAALAAAVDQLYEAAGYPAPKTRPAAQAALKAANDAVTAAETNLTEAQAALTAAKAGPSSAELTAAQNAVSQAQRDLDAAIAAQQNPDAEPGLSVAAAQEALNLAQAQLTDLNKPRDTTAEQAVVTQATEALDKAKADAADAALSTVSPKDLLAIPTQTLRVDNVQTTLGVIAEGEVITYTDTTLYARADLTDSQRVAMITGTEVEVELPDGTIVPGVVAEVESATQDPMTWEIIPAHARIDIADQATVAAAGRSGVTIRLVQAEADDTLVVPVTALVALSEGGYAVQKTDGTLVGVDVGLVADTRAQITPTYGELNEGDEVVVA